MRIEKACDLLVSSDIRIEEIAFDVGFGSREHFSQVFKKICNMSPNSYRMKYSKAHKLDLFHTSSTAPA